TSDTPFRGLRGCGLSEAWDDGQGRKYGPTFGVPGMGGNGPGAWWRRIGTGAICCGLSLELTAGGCAFGPRVLERSYGPYYESLRHVDEEEFLRNLVHMRYHETPSSLGVSSIAAQYELSGQAEARPFFIAPNPSNSNVIFRTFTAILPDVSAMGSNRPT